MTRRTSCYQFLEELFSGLPSPVVEARSPGGLTTAVVMGGAAEASRGREEQQPRKLARLAA